MTDQEKTGNQSMSEAAKEARRMYARKYRENMSEAAKEARRAYKREWNHRNPDKVRKHTRDYWERQAARAAAKEGEPPEAEPGADHKADI